jgi:hypothetical protein
MIFADFGDSAIGVNPFLHPHRAALVAVLAIPFLLHFKIKDRIVLTENLGAAGSGTAAQNLAVKAVLDANGFNSVGAARFFINGLDTTTRGVDIVAAYNFRPGTWAAGP